MPTRKKLTTPGGAGATVGQKKYHLAVDQYTACLREIPIQRPRTRETVSQPSTLPVMVKQLSANEWLCELCQCKCNSFKTLEEHRAGIVHRKSVYIEAIKSKRFLDYMLQQHK